MSKHFCSPKIHDPVTPQAETVNLGLSIAPPETARILQIKMDRGHGWELRSRGDTDATIGQIKAALVHYCTQYPHRALLNGALVAECVPAQRR